MRLRHAAVVAIGWALVGCGGASADGAGWAWPVPGDQAPPDTGRRPIPDSQATPSPPPLSSEQDLLANLDSRILRYYERGEAHTFAGVDGVTIDYRVFRSPTPGAALVIVNGKGESHAKYAEVLYDLRNSGYTVFVYDHRGQGFSGRMLDDSQKHWVATFDNYVADLTTLIRDVVRPAHANQRVFALGHSMGGLILALQLASDPGLVDAAVLSSPMLGVQWPLVYGVQMTEWRAYWVARMMFAEAWAPGEGPYDPDEPFAGNTLTRSQARFEMAKRVNTHFADFADGRGIAIGGATAGWVEQSILAMQALRDRARDLQTPLLLLTAGADQKVTPSDHAAVCAAAAACRQRTLVGSAHEPLMERDPIRQQTFDLLLSFFEQHSLTGRVVD